MTRARLEARQCESAAFVGDPCSLHVYADVGINQRVPARMVRRSGFVIP